MIYQSPSDDDLEQIKEIFFSNSSIKTFFNEEEKEKFLNRWLLQYLTHFPDWLFFYKEKHKVLGYLIACPDSKKYLGLLNIPGQELFEEYFKDFPAHLHINCHLDSQGKGVGGKLIQHFEKKCLSEELSGWHIITQEGMLNNSFYRKVGCVFEKIRDLKGHQLLMQGKELS